ncbi:hypothetical protein KQI42_15980 [Tissierella sp. MSJ-40]|uniref:CPBP family intramembrane metalloprotease n=1 Tax=Tissierella simiarum TaxID=2841534 RepID=A0ABS6E9A9_9FIRM|nr:hypothetical protein [Tissierella simiarum]MBU5439515.1 hypothetical protein [Tissierella simiarum]
MDKKVTGWDYFSLGMLAFAGLGLEALYAYVLEPMIYGITMQEWNTSQTIIHWIITCISWGIVGYLLILASKKKYQFNLFETADKMTKWQWISVIFCVVIALVASYIDWKGFKIIREFQSKGLLLFVFQYIYYAFETVLFMLIIIFTQKAFEASYKRKNIPYGGIICGITWGLAHAFTKGSIWIGLEGIVLGFLLGVTYLLVNRDIKKTYIALFIMFAL